VSEYFHCAVERLIRHHLWWNEACCFFSLHILELLLGIDLVEIFLDLVHLVVVHFGKDFLTAVNFLIDVLLHLFLGLQLILDFEIELVPWQPLLAKVSEYLVELGCIVCYAVHFLPQTLAEL